MDEKNIEVKASNKRKYCLILICTLILVVLAFGLSVLNDVFGLAKSDKTVEIEVPSGSGTIKISSILKDEGLINYPFVFRQFSKFKGYDGEYSPGEHILNNNMSYNEMMLVLKEPKFRESVQVTVPEGYTINQIAKALEDKGVCSKHDFIKAVTTIYFGFDFESEVPNDKNIFYKLEGYFFPDTYSFYPNEKPEVVATRMLTNFKVRLSDDILSEMKRQGYTLHELLTIASIVQAEAPYVSEMRKVASVYLNRLHSPDSFPRLEADPTRDYAYEDLQDSGASNIVIDEYNTYVGLGLPPGPINSPGLDAIKAVLNPESTPYYFFCTNLETLEFFYAKTFNEHNKNVVKAGLRGN